MQLGLPEAKQLRGKETVSAILEATSKVLFEQGESRIRIQEISEATNISIGSIYHHFGNRESLVIAAFVNNFSREFRLDILVLKQALDSLKPTDIGEPAKQLLRKLFSQSLTDERALQRIFILGNIASRPELRNAVSHVQTEMIDSLTDSIERVMSLGILRQVLSARAIALAVIGLMAGRVMKVLDEKSVTDQEWNEVAVEFLGGLLNPAMRPKN
jgi:AcrR family transcriptional regulator